MKIGAIFLAAVPLAFLMTVAVVASSYLRSAFECHVIRFRGKRWVQPAGRRDQDGRLPWSAGIAIRLRHDRHLLVIRR